VTHDIEEAVYLADRIVALGGKPGEVRSVREIDAARPRQRGTLALQEVAAKVKADIAADAAAPVEDYVI
jgi:NitT/TauT family transport system ATP-binding protein